MANYLRYNGAGGEVANLLSYLNLSCIMLKNGQTYFKNLAVFTQIETDPLIHSMPLVLFYTP